MRMIAALTLLKTPTDWLIAGVITLFWLAVASTIDPSPTRRSIDVVVQGDQPAVHETLRALEAGPTGWMVRVRTTDTPTASTVIEVPEGGIDAPYWPVTAAEPDRQSAESYGKLVGDSLRIRRVHGGPPVDPVGRALESSVGPWLVWLRLVRVGCWTALVGMLIRTVDRQGDVAVGMDRRTSLLARAIDAAFNSAVAFGLPLATLCLGIWGLDLHLWGAALASTVLLGPTTIVLTELADRSETSTAWWIVGLALLGFAIPSPWLPLIGIAHGGAPLFHGVLLGIAGIALVHRC